MTDSSAISGFYELEKAWWEWVNTKCPYKSPRTRGKWMNENIFEYKGTTWTRSYHAKKSNSGKTTVDSSTHFMGADGRQFEELAASPNRRNDPDRSHGLPRSRGYR
jgi:hypothetical protein